MLQEYAFILSSTPLTLGTVLSPVFDGGKRRFILSQICSSYRYFAEISKSHTPQAKRRLVVTTSTLNLLIRAHIWTVTKVPNIAHHRQKRRPVITTSTFDFHLIDEAQVYKLQTFFAVCVNDAKSQASFRS